MKHAKQNRVGERYVDRRDDLVWIGQITEKWTGSTVERWLTPGGPVSHRAPEVTG